MRIILTSKSGCKQSVVAEKRIINAFEKYTKRQHVCHSKHEIHKYCCKNISCCSTQVSLKTSLILKWHGRKRQGANIYRKYDAHLSNWDRRKTVLVFGTSHTAEGRWECVSWVHHVVRGRCGPLWDDHCRPPVDGCRAQPHLASWQFYSRSGMKTATRFLQWVCSIGILSQIIFEVNISGVSFCDGEPIDGRVVFELNNFFPNSWIVVGCIYICRSRMSFDEPRDFLTVTFVHFFTQRSGLSERTAWQPRLLLASVKLTLSLKSCYFWILRLDLHVNQCITFG